MTQTQLTAIDVFKRTPRTNCGECGLPNCMAFALQVVHGQKRPQDCPYLDAQTAQSVVAARPEPSAPEPGRRESLLVALKNEILDLDLPSVATKLGGWMRGDRLVIRCLGKLFEIDPQGGLHSDAHVHNWIHMPLLQYVVHGEGKDLTGVWTAFRQLNGFREWNGFFSHRCEKPFHEMADRHTDLFFDLLGLFGKDFHLDGSTADRSFILYPLPKVPLVFCYWAPEEDFESKLTLLLDKATEANLGAEGTFLLVQGIVEMFTKIISRHTNP
jgi:hypothetical protein